MWDKIIDVVCIVLLAFVCGGVVYLADPDLGVGVGVLVMLSGLWMVYGPQPDVFENEKRKRS